MVILSNEHAVLYLYLLVEWGTMEANLRCFSERLRRLLAGEEEVMVLDAAAKEYIQNLRRDIEIIAYFLTGHQYELIELPPGSFVAELFMREINYLVRKCEKVINTLANANGWK